MDVKEMVGKNFTQMWATLDRGLDGLTPDELSKQPTPSGNSIGWLAWHMARIEDWWVHSVVGTKPVPLYSPREG